jgi:hypothetical protein
VTSSSVVQGEDVISASVDRGERGGGGTEGDGGGGIGAVRNRRGVRRGDDDYDAIDLDKDSRHDRRRLDGLHRPPPPPHKALDPWDAADAIRASMAPSSTRADPRRPEPSAPPFELVIAMPVCEVIRMAGPAPTARDEVDDSGGRGGMNDTMAGLLVSRRKFVIIGLLVSLG